MREVFGVSSFGIHEWESTASYNLVGASNLVDVLYINCVLLVFVSSPSHQLFMMRRVRHRITYLGRVCYWRVRSVDELFVFGRRFVNVQEASKNIESVPNISALHVERVMQIKKHNLFSYLYRPGP